MTIPKSVLISRPWLLPMAITVALLAGCASKSQLLPEDGPTIRQIYDQHLSDDVVVGDFSDHPRPNLPVASTVDPEPDAASISERFPRLYNPTLTLYVYPHLVGAEGIPVPGYFTVFPLYPRIEYALPGEPIEQSTASGSEKP